MQDLNPPVPHVSWTGQRRLLIRPVIANIACALIVGLCAALPAAGLTAAIAVAVSCLSQQGCNTPTVVDSMVPVVAATVGLSVTVVVGVHQIKLLLAATRSTLTSVPR